MIHKHVPNPNRSALKHVRIAGLINYISDPDDGGKCIFFGLSPAFICNDVAGAILEMAANARGAVRSSDTVHHVVMSWPADELPTPVQAAEAVRIYIAHIGFEEHLYAYALHANTDNRHLHIVLDRSTPEGKVRKINRGFTQIAGAEAIALIEAAQGWRSEESAMISILEDGTLARSSSQRLASDLAPSPPQRVLDQAAHTGDDTRIEIVQKKLGDLFRNVETWPQLHDALATFDFRYECKGGGAVIKHKAGDGVFKASSISRYASLRKLEKRLGPFSEIHAPAPAFLDRQTRPQDAEVVASLEGQDFVEAFERYHAAVQAERYRVTSLRTDPQTGKKLVMMLDRRPGETIGLTVDELRARIPEIKRRDTCGENLSLTPLSSHFHHLVVDDINAGGLAALKAQGVSPAVVLELSPDSFQAVVNVPRVAPDDLDCKAANMLLREINQELGASKLRGAIHPHRMPGSRNQHPKQCPTERSSIVRIVEVTGGWCRILSDRLRAIYQRFALTADPLCAVGASPAASGHLPSCSPASSMPDAVALAVYEAQRTDVTRLFRKADDLSRLDLMIAGRLAATGLSQFEVAGAIQAGLLSATRHAKHADPYDYAVRTAAHAFKIDNFARRQEQCAEGAAAWHVSTDSMFLDNAPDADRDGPTIAGLGDDDCATL